MLKNNVILWKSDNVEWGPFPLTNDVTSFDEKSEVYLSITDQSSIDDKYLYNVCVYDHRKENPVSWHKKFMIHNNEYFGKYVTVHGRRIYIEAIRRNRKLKK